MKKLSAHQLARQLLELPDHEVHFAYNAGDYWRTLVAPIASKVEVGLVRYSTYHNLDEVVAEEDEDQSGRTVVVIS